MMDFPNAVSGGITAKLRRPEAQWQHQAMQRVANNKDKRQARRLWVACSEWLHAPTVPETAPEPRAPKPARRRSPFRTEGLRENAAKSNREAAEGFRPEFTTR